jgi:Rhamnan synthesis protein F
MGRLFQILYRIARTLFILTFRWLFSIYYVLFYYIFEMPRARMGIGFRRHPGTPGITGLWCIFAISQRTQISKNLITFLSCLQRVGYNVILINNGPSSNELVTAYLPYCHTVIEKPSGGRDFGGYKWGTEFLRRMTDGGKIDQVIYCNDSIFIRPSTFEQLLQTTKQMNDDYIGITEVFQYHYHVQSWFFVISGRVFGSSEFHGFWQKYIPYSSRTHSINKGEAGISKHLMQYGVYPRLLYTQSMILDLIFTGTTAETLERFMVFFSPGEYRGLRQTMENIAIVQTSDQQTVMSSLKRGVMERIALSNTAHMTNLLLLKCSTFPFLKKDLVYRAQYFFSQVDSSMDHWTGDDAMHVAEILGYFRARGSLRWQHSPAAMLARMGIL